MVQIGFPDEYYVIDVAKVDIRPLLPYFESNKWKKILFNGAFDIQFIRHNYGTTFRHIFDCMIAEKVIAPESKWGNKFEDLALKYLNVKLDKTVRQSFVGKKTGNFTEDQIRYSAEDVEYLFPLMDLQVEKLTTSKLLHIADLEFDLVPAVADMELTGVPVNKEKWRAAIKEYQEEHEQVRRECLSLFTGVPIDNFVQQMGLFGDGLAMPEGVKAINLNSPPQIKAGLARHGIYVEATDEQHLAVIDHPIPRKLLEYKKLQKLISSYGESVMEKVHPFTGRIHADWHQVGTETGRFSCSKPNLQQVPPKLRKAIGGETDYVLIGADFSQMELRILAQESGDPILVDAFQNGKDIHTVTACTMFNLKPEDVTKEQRYTAKTLNFGITYGMKARKFMDMMNGEANKEGRETINLQEAQALLDKYKETYPVASKYLETTGIKSFAKGMTQTRFGRKRFFAPISTDLPPKQYRAKVEGIKRQGANMPIQGTNADITKMAMIALHEDLTRYGFRASIILQVHDEIVLLTHKNQAESIRPLLVHAMEEAGKVLVPDIPIVVDSYVAEYWDK